MPDVRDQEHKEQEEKHRHLGPKIHRQPDQDKQRKQRKQHCDDQVDQPFMLEKTDLGQQFPLRPCKLPSSLQLFFLAFRWGIGIWW